MPHPRRPDSRGPFAERFGRNLLTARRRVGYSQEELASLCSVHRTKIGHLEHGRRLPRVDTLVKLASALALAPGDLLKGLDWVVGTARKGQFLVEP